MATYIVYNTVSKLKIGATNKKTNIYDNLRRRYQTSLGKNLSIVIFECRYPFIMEKKVHQTFTNNNESLEIFNIPLEEVIDKMKQIQQDMEKITIDLDNLLKYLPHETINMIAADNKISTKNIKHTILEMILMPVNDILNCTKATTYRTIAKNLQFTGKTKMEIMEQLFVAEIKTKPAKTAEILEDMKVNNNGALVYYKSNSDVWVF
jgi:hypothetical protein